MTKLRFSNRGTTVSYELWVRRKGTKEWKFNCTPDSNSAEQSVIRWAKESPEFEHRLDKTTKTKETVIIK